ncbi:MAG: hypothetical protein JXR29_08375, partial [Methylothermaceae bacterium]|nr:hypothetical protein [Methylothermaceae bacterium]
QIHYRRLYLDPTRVDAYARSRWIAPLPELIEESLRGTDDERGYRLHIRLLAFEQIFEHPDRARVVMRFHAMVEATGGRALGERRFRFSLPTATPNAAGAVTAFANLMKQASVQLRAWLMKIASERSSFPSARSEMASGSRDDRENRDRRQTIRLS